MVRREICVRNLHRFLCEEIGRGGQSKSGATGSLDDFDGGSKAGERGSDPAD